MTVVNHHIHTSLIKWYLQAPIYQAKLRVKRAQSIFTLATVEKRARKRLITALQKGITMAKFLTLGLVTILLARHQERVKMILLTLKPNRQQLALIQQLRLLIHKKALVQ